MLETVVGLSEQVRRDRQVDGRGLWTHVPQEDRQVIEPVGWPDARSVPAKKSPDGKRMAQVMDPRPRRPFRPGKAELRHQILLEDIADRWC